jgi:hypothetical protein
MPIYEKPDYYAGKPVAVFELEDTDFDVEAHTPKFSLNYPQSQSGMTIPQLLADYVKLPQAIKTQALLVGNWGFGGPDSGPVVEALVAYRDRLPELRSLFIGDISYEENEISWINQSDLSAVWPSYPKLEQIGVRGGNGLTLGRICSTALKSLTIEAGGLPSRVIRDALAAESPNLEHLEIWTGARRYGADSSPADFAALFAGGLFPKLKTLALRDCEYADDLAKAIAEAPILGRIETLDLSLGNLSDKGGEALLASKLITGLKRLDLHHHYFSAAMMERLKALPMEIDLSKPRKADGYGYGEEEDELYRRIAVSE